MAYYIEKAASAINSKTYASVEDAIADFCTPAWAGAKPTEIVMLSDTEFRSRGDLYKIRTGTNPRTLKAEAQGAPQAKNTVQHPPRGKSAGQFSRWLTAEMNRADSDF